MKAKPYVGITGPVDVVETKDVVNEFEAAGYNLNSPHLPMIGFLVSYKTLNGQIVENKRYPRITELERLLKATEGKVFTTVHYNSSDRETLAEQVGRIFSGIYENNLCRGLQLNIPFPDLREVEKIKKYFPEMQIIFQASRKVMEGKNPKQIAAEIRDYDSLVNYVLIDPSGGKGELFDLNKSIEIYYALSDKCPEITVGFAGGFTGKNVLSRADYIVEKIKSRDFCIDAEGGLRDKLSERYGDDLLSIEKVIEFTQSASNVLR